jgi:hypothetical protein
LFAEVLGIVVTVWLVDWGIRLRERQRALPAKIAAYNEVNLLLGKICSTWTDMVKASLSEPPAEDDDLFAPKYVQLIERHFDLDASTGSFQQQSWRRRLTELPDMITSSVDRILNRYGTHVDAALIGALSDVENQHTFKKFWSP